MHPFLESDTGFYIAVGVFTIAVFVIGMAVLALTNPAALDSRGIFGFIGGFGLFMLVFFIALGVHVLEDGDGI